MVHVVDLAWRNHGHDETTLSVDSVVLPFDPIRDFDQNAAYFVLEHADAFLVLCHDQYLHADCRVLIVV